MTFLDKLPARSISMIFMMSVLSYTFTEVLYFLIAATVIGIILFAFAMKYKIKYTHHKGTLKYKLIGSVLILGDVYLNFAVCPILFDQWYTPSKTTRFGWLVTDRLIWNKSFSTGYRFRLAHWLCKILNKYDKDGHC